MTLKQPARITAFDQILQFVATKTDDDLNELDHFDIRCRLPTAVREQSDDGATLWNYQTANLGRFKMLYKEYKDFLLPLKNYDTRLSYYLLKDPENQYLYRPETDGVSLSFGVKQGRNPKGVSVRFVLEKHRLGQLDRHYEQLTSLVQEHPPEIAWEPPRRAAERQSAILFREYELGRGDDKKIRNWMYQVWEVFENYCVKIRER